MNICVFCGSASGGSTIYANVARELAQHLSDFRHGLVYGGGNIGLMGIIADEMLARKAKVIGVIPDFLAKREVAHQNLSELVLVESMHERKQRMADLADAFIAMPGGMGTLDELAEILTWKQLGLINKPIGLLNINHFFDPLFQQFTWMIQEGFLKKENVDDIIISNNPKELVTLIGVETV